MKIKLRSKRLARLFAEVWERLPEADQALLSHKTKLVVDNPIFLPKENLRHIRVWATVIVIGVRKSIAILYLNPQKLPRQSDDFIKYVIAHELGHVFCGHIDELFSSASDDLTREAFESEADERASTWGLPLVPSTRPPKPSRSFWK